MPLRSVRTTLAVRASGGAPSGRRRRSWMAVPEGSLIPPFGGRAPFTPYGLRSTVFTSHRRPATSTLMSSATPTRGYRRRSRPMLIPPVTDSRFSKGNASGRTMGIPNRNKDFTGCPRGQKEGNLSSLGQIAQAVSYVDEPVPPLRPRRRAGIVPAEDPIANPRDEGVDAIQATRGPNTRNPGDPPRAPELLQDEQRGAGLGVDRLPPGPGGGRRRKRGEG